MFFGVTEHLFVHSLSLFAQVYMPGRSSFAPPAPVFSACTMEDWPRIAVLPCVFQSIFIGAIMVFLFASPLIRKSRVTQTWFLVGETLDLNFSQKIVGDSCVPL